MPTPLPLRGMFAAPAGATPAPTQTTTPTAEGGSANPYGTSMSSAGSGYVLPTTTQETQTTTPPSQPPQDLRNPYGTTGNSFGPNGAFGGFVTGQGYVNDQQKEPDQRDNITSLLTNRQFQYFDPTRGIFSFGRT